MREGGIDVDGGNLRDVCAENRRRTNRSPNRYDFVFIEVQNILRMHCRLGNQVHKQRVEEEKQCSTAWAVLYNISVVPGSLAQLVEQRLEEPCVHSSSL